MAAAQQKPCFLCNVILRDGNKRRDARLRRQQVITGGEQLIMVDVEPIESSRRPGFRRNEKSISVAMVLAYRRLP